MPDESVKSQPSTPKDKEQWQSQEPANDTEKAIFSGRESDHSGTELMSSSIF